MSGVDIIGALLLGDAPVTAAIPAERIKAGKLPDGIVLPALLVRSVSTVERIVLRRRGLVRQVERVSVTIRAASYRDQRAGVALVRDACAGFVGDVAGASRVSVLNAGTGPDVLGPADSFEQAQDFRVSFEEPL